jgi:hypothetical protein
VNQGERAARERVEEVYAAADRLTPEDLQFMTVAWRDPDERQAKLDVLEELVDRHGRGDLLDEARDWLHEALDARSVARTYVEGGLGRYPALGRPEDQVQVMLALEDAVAVAVAEDLLRPAEAAALADPGRQLLGMERLEGSPEPPEESEPSGWEPSADDWVAASDGESAVDANEPMTGVRPMRVAFFTVAAVIGVPAAILFGLANDALPMGVLGAGAVLALCWTFATYRSAGRG